MGLENIKFPKIHVSFCHFLFYDNILTSTATNKQTKKDLTIKLYDD